MFFKHNFGVSVWLVLVIRSGIKMLYFDCILGILLHYFNGKSIVNSLDKGAYMYLNHFDAKRKKSIDAKVSQHDFQLKISA